MPCSEVELYLFRHAESVMNAGDQRLVDGRCNEAPLTLTGQGQAQILGNFLKRMDIVPDDVFTSPAVRAIETGRIVLGAIGVSTEPVIVSDLQELDWGEWIGGVRAEVFNAEVMAEANRIGKGFKAPGGESLDEVGQRMLKWVSETLNPVPIKDGFGSRRVFAFSHRGAIRCLASHLLSWTREETYAAPMDNTAVSLLTLRNGQWSVEYVGKTPHLVSANSET